MSETIVNEFEAVQVEDEHGGPTLPPVLSCQGALKLVRKQISIWQSGEGIVQRLILQALHQFAPGTDVLGLNKKVAGLSPLVAHEGDVERDPQSVSACPDEAELYLIVWDRLARDQADPAGKELTIIWIGDVREGKGPFFRRAADKLVERSIDLHELPVDVNQRHAGRGITKGAPKAFVTRANLGEEPSSAHGDAQVLAEGDHQVQIRLAQPRRLDGLNVEDARDTALVVNRNADLREDAIERGEKVWIVVCVLKQDRRPGPRDAAGDAPVRGNPVNHPRVAHLVLQHEVITFDRVETH